MVKCVGVVSTKAVVEENVAVGKSCSVQQKEIVYTGIVILELMICCTVNCAPTNLHYLKIVLTILRKN